MNATVKEVYNDCVEIAWEPVEGAESIMFTGPIKIFRP